MHTTNVHITSLRATAASPSAGAALHRLSRALRVLISRAQRLYLNYVMRRNYFFSWLHRLYINYAMCRNYSPPATMSLHQPCRAPRVLITQPHGHYINYVVRRDYSSPGRTGSISTTSCAATTRLPVARALPQPCHAPSCRSTSRRSVALARAVRPVTTSRGATTRRPDCTSSIAPMPCIRTCRLAARLLVGRSHWLPPCVRSLHLAARLLVVRLAPALLRLCRASGRAVSPLDFLSVGRTSSRRVSGHCVSRRDYSSSGLHRPYCAYAVHPDTPSRRSTSR
jgi:hypothetical protein